MRQRLGQCVAPGAPREINQNMRDEVTRSDTKGDRKPNILLILCDQLRADALGCYGNPIVQTPHLDRLARSGAVYEQCIVTQPTCTPSRASILTGCYPSALRTHGGLSHAG
ncbi:MAG: sulfatase-like hydrolase/transferase [Caldilineaceae bacterium]